jgi:hypothetical protein
MLRLLASNAASLRLHLISKAASGRLQACTATFSCRYSTSTPEGHENFIGAYTPVTKQLWEERLAWSGRKQKQQPQQQGSSSRGSAQSSSSSNSSAESSGGKPAEVTQVSYDFTTNRTLVELVSQPHGAVHWHACMLACAVAWVLCMGYSECGVCIAAPSAHPQRLS